jgi:hypothetical protein
MQGHEWYPAEPHQAKEWLQHFAALWWIAGGWAIELFLEQTTRAHTDLDVGVLRRDVPTLRGALPEWEFFEAKDGRLIGTVSAGSVTWLLRFSSCTSQNTCVIATTQTCAPRCPGSVRQPAIGFGKHWLRRNQITRGWGR